MTTQKIKLCQLNIRGILSSDVQHHKCYQLNKLIETKQIDTVLLQEWSATKLHVVPQEEKNIFPEKYFPNYLVHFHSTECAILFHNGLCVTPLSLPNLSSTHHRSTSILRNNSTFPGFDYGILSHAKKLI